MDGKQMAKADFITAIVFIIGSLFILIVTLFFPRYPEWGPLYSNPGFTPFLLALSLLLMSIYLLNRSLKSQGSRIHLTGEMVNFFFKSSKVRRFLICMGLFILYYVLLGRIPFILDTSLYLFLAIMIFRRGKWYSALLISVATSIAVYLVFLRIFLVPLP
jgi:putative tricarboxylic transport membrane protein